jgi:hypothetical protein
MATVAVKTTMICINVRVENTFANKVESPPVTEQSFNSSLNLASLLPQDFLAYSFWLRGMGRLWVTVMEKYR